MKRQQGFTLIELVVVIVILGILATTAIPKFVKLKSDARIATLYALKGAISSGNSLVYAKALLQGVQKSPSSSVNMGNGVNVPSAYGYMQATHTSLAGVVNSKFDPKTHGNNATDFKYTYPSTATPARIHFRPQGAPPSCYLVYIQADATNPPQIAITTSGC